MKFKKSISLLLSAVMLSGCATFAAGSAEVESEPVGINAIPVRNSRALLIGIIIFSLIGMGVTLSLIIILRKNGFLPARGGKGRRTAM